MGCPTLHTYTYTGLRFRSTGLRLDSPGFRLASPGLRLVSPGILGGFLPDGGRKRLRRSLTLVGAVVYAHRNLHGLLVLFDAQTNTATDKPRERAVQSTTVQPTKPARVSWHTFSPAVENCPRVLSYVHTIIRAFVSVPHRTQIWWCFVAGDQLQWFTSRRRL